MRYSIAIVVFLFALAPVVSAQNLDTTQVSDQFDSGARGQETSGCGIIYGGACIDGADAVSITDTAGVTGTIGYINTWAGASTYDGTNGESPVRDITSANIHPDRNTALAGLSANTRPGATTPAMVVMISDDGGHNGLYWGQATCADYFVRADVLCQDRSAVAGYETSAVAVRCNQHPGTWVDYTFNMDRSGSYALVYDRMMRTIEAVTWTQGNTTTLITTRDAASRTVHGSLTNVAEGWYTFEVVALGTNIIFRVNGVELANITDSTYATGYAGLVMREGGVLTASEVPGYFDNMVSGPAALAVAEWSLY